MRVLVVEPSPTVHRTVLRALRLVPDCEIVIADEIADLEQIAPPLAMAILGWSSENDAGLDGLRALRAREGFEDTRVVLVSDRRAHDDVRAAKDAGATDYVLRPVTAETLAERLARLIAPDEPATRAA